MEYRTHDRSRHEVASLAVYATDTIAAVATPPGHGGVAVVRVSGPATRTIAQAVLGILPPPRTATYRAFHDVDDAIIDHGLAFFFPAPHSFTGEDVLELHGHGSPAALDVVLARLMTLGARLAHPGEFSERAFLNGKMDLAQAEALADLIQAGSAAAARAAAASLSGEFSHRVHALTERLIQLRMYVEAAIDFPEEEIDFLADAHIARELETVTRDTGALLASTQQGVLLHDGLTVVLAGPPNAGKSSLLNALAQSDVAIVSPVAGTTRDVLRERIHIDGMPLHLVDTAGLRVTQDAIESEGVRRTHAQMARADRVLLIMDDAAPDARALQEAIALLPESLPCTRVHNKIDLTRRVPGRVETAGGVEIALSASTGAGLDALRAHLKECAGFQPAGEGRFIARRRHLDAVRRAQANLACGRSLLTETRAGELLAEELRRAQQALGEITGEFTPDDLLGRIFSSFCIGK